eukprot:scaffold31065_cov38-Prasinocladus_malaysianus.AAC.1
MASGQARPTHIRLPRGIFNSSSSNNQIEAAYPKVVNLTARMPWLCPVKTAVQLPVAVSQTLQVLSALPVSRSTKVSSQGLMSVANLYHLLTQIASRALKKDFVPINIG